MITGGNRYPEYLIFVMLFGYQAADDVTTPAEQLLDPNDAPLFLHGQGARRHQERPQGVQRGVGFRLARMDELWQRLDRPLFVEQDELKLLLHHVLELVKRQLPVHLSRVAYELQ